MTKKSLSQERLKELLHYDPSAGIFTWKISVGRVINGSKAGTITSGGYISIYVDSARHSAHRLAWLYMTGAFPLNQIDHINHIRNDNKWSNLRDVNNDENKRNLSLQSNNTSGISGVNFYNGKWRARINSNGKRISLGLFDCLSDAAQARKIAEKKYGYHDNHGSK